MESSQSQYPSGGQPNQFQQQGQPSFQQQYGSNDMSQPYQPQLASNGFVQQQPSPYAQPQPNQQFASMERPDQQVILEEHHSSHAQSDTSDETVPLVSNETQIQIQDNLYHQQENHYCGYSLHYCSAFLNVGLWAATLFFIAMAAISQTQTRTALIDKLWMAAYISLPLLYVIYIIEAMFSSTSKYLWNLNYAEDATSFIYRLQHIAPVVWMECECYHYETRHRHVHKTV
jgi:hypothetical protein